MRDNYSSQKFLKDLTRQGFELAPCGANGKTLYFSNEKRRREHIILLDIFDLLLGTELCSCN
ncbi:MAG: hypothetical protein ABIA21_01215, partial [Candidatus Aenigmatarchaeota archaeon]